jgi:hypothetical protein
VWAWGSGGAGELGDGGSGIHQSTTPIEVGVLKGIVFISAGATHNLALEPDGKGYWTTWAWGSNAAGQLGDGTNTVRLTPGRVPNPNDVVSVGKGYGFTLALRRDASVWAWGANTSGQLGDGTTTTRYTPAAVPSFVLVDNSFVTADQDQDGVATGAEWALGSDPLNADTNADGLSDGLSLAVGVSPTNFDLDGDGVFNAVEIQQGSNPNVADTDGDGYVDGADCFPLDPTRNQCPQPLPGDTTPPTITLAEPTNAVLISSVP